MVNPLELQAQINLEEEVNQFWLTPYPKAAAAKPK